MNNYPVWWEQTLTIYNKHEDPQTHVITWYKNVVPNCFWKYNRDIFKLGDVTIESDSIICRIPKDDKFKEQYEWVELSNDDRNNYFTLGIGDIIIKGEVSDMIDEYTKGHRSTDIVTKYKKLQGCTTIELVAINTGTGKCNEHYYIQGI